MDEVGNTLTKYSDGRYKVHPDATGYTADDCEKAGYKIRTVQRVSDKEVFSIGDVVKMAGISAPAMTPITIDSIKVEENAAGGVALCQGGSMYGLKIAEHVNDEEDGTDTN